MGTPPQDRRPTRPQPQPANANAPHRQPPSWDEVEQARMVALAQTLVRWQQEAGLSQVQAARRIAPFVAPDLPGASHATLSRWQHAGAIRTARIAVLDSIAEALGHRFIEMAEAMETARDEVLASWVSGGMDTVQGERATQRARERRLLAAFRRLGPAHQELVVGQAEWLAQAQHQLPLGVLGMGTVPHTIVTEQPAEPETPPPPGLDLDHLAPTGAPGSDTAQTLERLHAWRADRRAQEREQHPTAPPATTGSAGAGTGTSGTVPNAETDHRSPRSRRRATS